MMTSVPQILAVVISYLVGSVPFGLLLGKHYANIDVRRTGSGNIGATNVLRAAGKKAAALTLVADAIKGLVPVLIVRLLFKDDLTTSVCGAAAILGHNFPIYLGFKGGKGVATSFGVVLAISPVIGAICLLTWLAAALLWKYSSLWALLAFAAYPLMTFLFYSSLSKPYAVLSLFVFGMIYYRHRENIKRLLTGTEPKIGSKQ